MHVVDTGQVGIAIGYAALTAADVLDGGGTAQAAAEAALARGEAATSLFYVDTLEYLRRGGRIGAAAAILGSALSVKPLLAIAEGRVAPRERVRTASRALARLADLAVEAAGDQPVDVCVSHLANAERAEELAAALAERLADGLEGREVMCGELGAVLGAHVGPGMVAVCVAPVQGAPAPLSAPCPQSLLAVEVPAWSGEAPRFLAWRHAPIPVLRRARRGGLAAAGDAQRRARRRPW